DIGDVDNQRVEPWSPFDFKDSRYGPLVESVGPQTINRFCGKGDDPARTQNLRRTSDDWVRIHVDDLWNFIADPKRNSGSPGRALNWNQKMTRKYRTRITPVQHLHMPLS